MTLAICLVLVTLFANTGWYGQFLEPMGLKINYTQLGIVLALVGVTGALLSFEQQIVGSIGGRRGSCVLRHDGRVRNADSPEFEVSSSWTVVPDSGSGELRGVRGTGHFTSRHEETETAYTFEYAF